MKIARIVIGLILYFNATLVSENEVYVLYRGFHYTPIKRFQQEILLMTQ